MPQAYEVHPYTLNTLRRLLAEKANTSLHAIGLKRHLDYFEEYFGVLRTETIVVENDYTDRDYLEDFAGYYVRCFQNYPRKCVRLHFFAQAFDEAAFTGLLTSAASPLTLAALQAAYIGFVVVKPLPRTIIGRTCLRTYPPEGRRDYPVLRPYDANLFGLPLSVCSLAFQEQDTVAAACATSALWSALQGTGRQFQHPIPSPVEITRAATAHVPLNTRTFPNSNGLTATQMAEAIRSVGLEPYVVNASDEYVLKSTLYAYLRGHIPILTVIHLYDSTPTPPVSLGLHAVTVAGYSLGSSHPVAFRQSGFLLRAFRMDKIYAHDDQVGPFARMEFAADATFTTSWLDDARTGRLNAQADIMLIPLYHKIRIPFQTVFEIVLSFNSLIEVFRQNGMIGYTEPLEWDIYLTNVNTFKTELQSSASLTGTHRLNVLTHSMPRFIWRSTAYCGDSPVLDLLFDATDIEQGLFFICAVEYDVALAQLLRAISPSLMNTPAMHLRPDRRIFEWFANAPF